MVNRAVPGADLQGVAARDLGFERQDFVTTQAAVCEEAPDIQLLVRGVEVDARPGEGPHAIEAEGEVDRRGSRGVPGVRPYFNWVRLEIRVRSNESPERFAKLIKNVEYRCPVMNLDLKRCQEPFFHIKH